MGFILADRIFGHLPRIPIDGHASGKRMAFGVNTQVVIGMARAQRGEHVLLGDVGVSLRRCDRSVTQYLLNNSDIGPVS